MLVSRILWVDQGAIKELSKDWSLWVLSLLQACLEEEDCVIIHVYLQDIIQMKRVGKIQGWSRLSQEWIKLINSQSVEDVPRGIKWSHGMVSIVHCALCANPWSMWEFYVGLGTCPWACVKRKISYNPWKGWHQVVIVIKIAVCKFKWSIMKRSSAWILPSIVVSMDLWRCAEEWLTHSGLWGSNHLVFIEPTQSRKVVQLEGVKIVII